MLFYLAVIIYVFKMYSKDFRIRNSETTSGASGGASGASRLIFQPASSFASGTACFIVTIERT